MMTPKWAKWMPDIRIFLQIPLIKIDTHLLGESNERMAWEIVRIRWQIWKWSGEFDLYKKQR